ncbi:MAG: ferredoxin [Syntrophorhabdus sp. PtaU1.Bin153]|nr:MAG: ferredoxin [Syntrophorhabdus sp. PtaU1.Bin153]
MEKKTRKILRSNERCAGCGLCVLTCSFFNFGVFGMSRSFMRLERDDRTTSFVLSIDDGCKSCGECVRACAYKALRWEDEDPRSRS